MVMHARKLPRINDGFSEKHQTHGYENSKYSKQYRYGSHEKSRDSPSANSLRSSSPDSHSQSPRYHKNAYYKVREKERERENRDRERDRDRERERDREYKDYRDRTDSSRSPKDRRREIREREREREHRESRGIHERINSVHKKEEKERLMRVGEWSEHVSSSGKKYYYNCRTEVSQWEKPPEWLEWERSHRGSGSAVTSGSNHMCKESSLSSVAIHRSQHEKSRQDKHSNLSDGYRDSRDMREGDRERRDFRNEDHYDRRESRKYPQDVGTTDMEISSGDSTPTSESLHNRVVVDGNQDMVNNNPSVSNLHMGSSSHFPKPHSKLTHSNMVAPSASLSSSLPGSGTTSISTSSSHITNNGTPGTSSLVSSSVPPTMPQLLNSHPRLMALSSTNLSEAKGGGGIVSNLGHSQDGDLSNVGNKPQLEPLTIAANSINIGAGPPTPTHSESQDGLDIRKIGSPNSSLNSLQSLTQTSINSLALTPSLNNYYKEELISHVQSWPAEGIEKQCQRLSEEAHTMGSLIMTKVSADLKMARSLVRLAEIQATLHEQRILFLRAQKRELEEVKAQNCFMNDT